jgi:ring-1,2-phenylacetyl-CoA epoxidase subunit PaaB
MSDTQWPRYLVFEQNKAGKPHTLAGSVHAPDAEMALFNARDVFSRRPEILSLWAVRADHCFTRTAEELNADPGWLESISAGTGEAETYHVFEKSSHRGVHTYMSDVEATDPDHAIKLAVEGSGAKAPILWWVIPAAKVIRSRPEDIAEMFEIAKTKGFRDQSQYLTQTRMRKIREGETGDG